MLPSQARPKVAPLGDPLGWRFAAIGTIRKQMNDTKWFWAAIAYQCGFGWVVGLIINQLWELFALGNFGFWTVVAIACLAGIIIQLFRPMPKVAEKPVHQEAQQPEIAVPERVAILP